MLVLLPPSQGKTGAAEGEPVDLRALSSPGLTPTRRRVLSAAARLSRTRAGREALGAGSEQLRPEAERTTRWRTEPAVPVAELYTGVLYDALDPASLDDGARERAVERLLVSSAAWGALRLDDRVPPYRLSMGVALPDLGGLAALWREPLRAALDPLAAGRLVVDCRSADYAAAWTPRGGTASRTASVRVLRESGGKRSVVSHMAKHTRGLVARACALEPSAPTTPEELRDLLAAALPPLVRDATAASVRGADEVAVELGAPAKDGRRALDVVLR
ncbi:peroxide stress protein YaaA [Pseudokineococcus marinus]|uniref:Peroxide stress protein YaaA n=1 Tax=Pseudokineococcus marinus TaxID=351215 RepID=A0A849BW05_9ACTN|nr:peroxide stress protein YaaA [Pseudokineococcus marinus]NNH24554.1 peroxide stress protein YaaA [Pseudokineococcus marinus]